MAARLRKTHQADVRAKIKTSQLINRLENHVFKKGDKNDLTGTQLKAIEILIRKTLPDLSTVTLSGDEDSPIIQEIRQTIVAAK
jgi:hypothetical protein